MKRFRWDSEKNKNSVLQLITENNNPEFAQSVCKMMHVYPKTELGLENKMNIKKFLLKYKDATQTNRNLMNCDINKTIEEI